MSTHQHILEMVNLQEIEAEHQGKELTPDLVHSWAGQQTSEGMKEYMKSRFDYHRELVLGTAFFLLLKGYMGDDAAHNWLSEAYPEDAVS